MKRYLKVVSRKQEAVGAKPELQERGISPREALFEQEIAHIEKKQSTLTALNDLARTISHYLNSPLTVLLGKVELLSQTNEEAGLSKEEVRRFIQASKREIFRMDAIIKAFQDIYQVQHKTYPPGVKMLDVEREVRNRTKDACFLR